ncbi:hypothetical protein AVEN_45487-1 [Araneus ventricosus]|uniref:Uncharacterized protein n=1 Tax=Araneus ventricosus TaxID=182803 RepID=A0A4Y2SLM4_ARAVE|nr:hypothetical protein AVEN_45487-1 [Araneus ventricosus]
MANVPSSGVVAKLAVPERSKRASDRFETVPERCKRVPERSKRASDRSERVPERCKRVPECSNLDDKNRAVLRTFSQFFLIYFSWEKSSFGSSFWLLYTPGP